MASRSVRAAASIVGIAAVVAVSLSACSTSDSTTRSSPGSTQITVATDNVTPLQAAIKAFEKTKPGITVKIEDGGNDYQNFLRTGLAAGNAADVIRTFPGAGNTAGVVPLAKAGSLVDLSDSSWASQLSTTQKTLFSFGGKVQSVPIGALGLGPIYDDQTLKAIGQKVPTKFSEVLSLCAAAKSHGKVAYSLFQKGGSVLPSYAMVASLVYQPDPQFTTQQEAGKKTFADSGWVTAFSLQLKMLKAGCFNDGPNGTDYNASASQIATGKAVATFGFSDTSSLEQTSPKGTTFTLAPMPVDDSGKLALAVADSSGFGVNNASKNKAAAEKFVDFLATAAGQNAYATAAHGAPSLPNDSFKADNKNQETVLSYEKDGKTGPWPDQGWPGQATAQALDTVSQTLFLGSDTPKSAAQKMDAAFAKDMASARQ